MKIYRPLWSEGAFLAPQQFQQQTRWDAYVADVVAHMSLSSPWGVISAEFDESALAVFRLNPVNLVVRFPDGTLVDTSVSDNLPPACDLSHLTGYNSVDVVLALPLLSANGGNLSLGGGVSRPCRWQQEWLPAAIPLRLENQYFALEINHPAAQAMLDAGNCAFYVPGTLGDIQLELFAVLRD